MLFHTISRGWDSRTIVRIQVTLPLTEHRPRPGSGRHCLYLATTVKHGDCPHMKNEDTEVHIGLNTRPENTFICADRASIPGQSAQPVPSLMVAPWKGTCGSMLEDLSSLSQRDPGHGGLSQPDLDPGPYMPVPTCPGLCVGDNGRHPSGFQLLGGRTVALTSGFQLLSSRLCALCLGAPGGCYRLADSGPVCPSEPS